MPASITKSQRPPRKPVALGRGKPTARSTAPPIVRDIFARTRTASFQRYLRDLLVELCKINTTPNPDVSRMQAAEDGCIRILERELSGLFGPVATVATLLITPVTLARTTRERVAEAP